jgi:ADP-ribosylation factor GTPase-activating protein 2/3
MKVGGNESATKYFQSHGGSAALASKDPKTKYTSTAATKYKEELARRVLADKKLYPNEVTITDVDESAGSGSATPAGEPEDDFFSSWDKPTIKRPSNPPSRTATPPVVSRTSSPFLTAGANGNGAARPKSPLNAETASAPAAARATPAAAIRKTAASTAGARKSTVLGAKKKGLGAKKVTSDVAVDFDEAERKAKEEAERIAKLGYNPDEETPAVSSSKATTTDDKIVAPTPLSPSRAGGFGATNKPRERSNSELERLGMGMGRLGFGQTAGAKPAPKKMGFGAVGRSVQEEGKGSGSHIIPCYPTLSPYHHVPLTITHTKQTNPTNSPARNSEPKRASPATSSLAGAPSTPQPKPSPNRACKTLTAQRPSRQTPTLDGPRTK